MYPLSRKSAQVDRPGFAQLNQINRQLLTIRAEQVSLNEQISYHTVQAPVAGQVFDRQIKPLDVVNTNESVLKLVPAKRLEASVNISDGYRFHQGWHASHGVCGLVPGGRIWVHHGQGRKSWSGCFAPIARQSRLSLPSHHQFETANRAIRGKDSEPSEWNGGLGQHQAALAARDFHCDRLIHTPVGGREALPLVPAKHAKV